MPEKQTALARLAVRVLKPLLRAVEGGVRDGPYLLPVSGGWLPAGSAWNFWQLGQDVRSVSLSAMVEACVSAYAQTMAMLPGDHWWLNKDGGRERVTTSALSRVLKRPNTYQTTSDFLLNAVTGLYSDGNAYALALRNERYEIYELHLMNPRSCGAIVAEGGEIFYSLSGNPIIDRMSKQTTLMVPARDVLHLRLKTSSYNPLLGESPIVSAARDIAAGDAMAQQQINFYLNQARPSAVLMTDLQLTAEESTQLRDRWNEQSRGIGAGGTPILSHGLKPGPLPTTNPVDAQLAEVMKMTDQRIALAFRVPLQLLGLGGAPMGSTESLMQFWLASGLQFCLNHVETAFDDLFGLKGIPTEYTEFDTSALLRSEMKSRVESAARGVQGGIFSPNEARASFELGKVEYGEEPRVQAQVVPLSAAQGIPSAPSAPSSPAAQPASEDLKDVDTTKQLGQLVAAKVTGKNILGRSSRLAQRSLT